MDNLTERPIIKLPSCKKKDWRRALPTTSNRYQQRKTEIDCNDWHFRCRDLKQLISNLENLGFQVSGIYSTIPETIISASALGLSSQLILPESEQVDPPEEAKKLEPQQSSGLLFHEGTLRSGEHLDHEGNILLLGDVNPGAKVSATGDVMICGRLMGTAHAGKDDKPDSKIVALQLRPLQLRIANQIARGPEGKPQMGLAEEARIKNGVIVIQPANPNIFCKSAPKKSSL